MSESVPVGNISGALAALRAPGSLNIPVSNEDQLTPQYYLVYSAFSLNAHDKILVTPPGRPP